LKNIRGNSNILIVLWRDFAFFDSLLYHTLELKKKANGKIYIFMPKKEKLLEKLAKYQIDRVFFLDNEECIYDASIFTDQVSKIILNKNCNLVLFNNTLNDREISSRLSIRLNIPVCYTCSLVDYKNNQWHVLSLEDGERVISEYFFDKAVLVHLQTSFELEIKNNQTKTPAIEKIVSVKNSSIRLIKWEKQKNSGNAVTKAQLVIGVGRGLSKEYISKVKHLAELMNAQIAVTRPLADVGWFPEDRKVGYSGVTIKPLVYIALGISGAFQHIVGMLQSKKIIVINNNRYAPLYQLADYGVIGDLHRFIDTMVDRLE